jgi:hypothetical protein
MRFWLLELVPYIVELVPKQLKLGTGATRCSDCQILSHNKILLPRFWINRRQKVRAVGTTCSVRWRFLRWLKWYGGSISLPTANGLNTYKHPSLTKFTHTIQPIHSAVHIKKIRDTHPTEIDYQTCPFVSTIEVRHGCSSTGSWPPWVQGAWYGPRTLRLRLVERRQDERVGGYSCAAASLAVAWLAYRCRSAAEPPLESPTLLSLRWVTHRI